jgi:hypothetical protein
VRASVSEFGAPLPAKVLDLNDVQTSVLSLVFHYAEAHADAPIPHRAATRAPGPATRVPRPATGPGRPRPPPAASTPRT